MRRLLCVLVCAAVSFVPAESRATDPDPGRSSAPDFIDLVGQHDGVADPFGAFTVTIRDAVGAPIPFAPVSIDFSGCSTVAPSSRQPYPGLTMDCSAMIVAAMADAGGVAHFDIVGATLHRAPIVSGACAIIRAGANATVIKSARVTTVDNDGVNGVGPNDQSLVVCDFQQYLLGGLYRSRSDFNHDLNLTTADVGIINSIASGQTSSESGTRCDGVPVEPIHAEDGGLDVAWTRCISDGGTSLKIDDCAPTPSPPTHRLVFSVVAPSGITNLAGFQAEVVITSRDTQTPLPAFWRFDSCKTSNALQSTSLCENLDVSLNSNKTYPWMGPYAERIIVTGTLGSPQDLVAGQEYGLFDLTRQGVGTTGTQCAGCQQPVQVVLRSLRLQHTTGCAEPQAASHAALADPPLDVLVDGRATSNHAFWQEAWTDVGNGPLSSSMSMRRASSSLGALVVDFVLPTAAPAALEVFDAAGRRLRSLSLGAMTAGPHRLGLAGSGEWAAGAYFLRLRQGAVARSITVTIVP